MEKMLEGRSAKQCLNLMSPSDDQRMSIWLWAVMIGFKQQNISFFKTDKEAKREFNAVLQRVSGVMFEGVGKQGVKYVKIMGKNTCKTWKTHGYHTELSLTFPLSASSLLCIPYLTSCFRSTIYHVRGRRRVRSGQLLAWTEWRTVGARIRSYRMYVVSRELHPDKEKGTQHKAFFLHSYIQYNAETLP